MHVLLTESAMTCIKCDQTRHIAQFRLLGDKGFEVRSARCIFCDPAPIAPIILSSFKGMPKGTKRENNDQRVVYRKLDGTNGYLINRQPRRSSWGNS